MTKEKIYPNHRKVFKYEPGSSSISYRIVGSESTSAAQFIRFDTPAEAAKYFEEEI